MYDIICMYIHTCDTHDVHESRGKYTNKKINKINERSLHNKARSRLWESEYKERMQSLPTNNTQNKTIAEETALSLSHHVITKVYLEKTCPSTINNTPVPT